MSNLSEQTIHSCRDTLQSLQSNLGSIQAAIISTVDGHFVTGYHTDKISGERFSAMNSSMLALGETLAIEAQQDVCNFVIVDNAKGYIVSLKIKSVYLLTTITQRSINLGLLLSHSRACAENLAHLLP